MAASALFTPHRGDPGRRGSNQVRHVVIYGAGNAGIELASALAYSRDQRAVAFIDDDSALHKQQLAGLKIHPLVDLSHLIKKLDVHEVLLALPSASHSRRREIITRLEPYPVHVRTLPGLSSIAQGKVKVEDISEVEIDDILGRDAVPPDHALLDANITGKVVMVTGAGGSIGSELCRQIVGQSPTNCPVTVMLLLELERFTAHARRQIDQTDRRVLQGERIPHEEKRFSLFEPHTEWISKGKAGVQVELGLRVCVMEDSARFILHHQVMEKTTDDKVAVSIK